ncbi:MAG: hypothetical protein ACTSWZ_07120 [Candidatus Heimdallarchaeaceae archaeon]
MELKKIGVLSLAKIAGIFGAIFGLLGSLFTIVYIKFIVPKLITKIPVEQQQILANVAMPEIGTLLLTVVVYAVVFFLGGIIYAWLYNLIAKWIGGVKLEFNEKKKKN